MGNTKWMGERNNGNRARNLKGRDGTHMRNAGSKFFLAAYTAARKRPKVLSWIYSIFFSFVVVSPRRGQACKSSSFTQPEHEQSSSLCSRLSNLRLWIFQVREGRDMKKSKETTCEKVLDGQRSIFCFSGRFISRLLRSLHETFECCTTLLAFHPNRR